MLFRKKKKGNKLKEGDIRIISNQLNQYQIQIYWVDYPQLFASYGYWHTLATAKSLTEAEDFLINRKKADTWITERFIPNET